MKPLTAAAAAMLLIATLGSTAFARNAAGYGPGFAGTPRSGAGVASTSQPTPVPPPNNTYGSGFTAANRIRAEVLAQQHLPVPRYLLFPRSPNPSNPWFASQSNTYGSGFTAANRIRAEVLAQQHLPVPRYLLFPEYSGRSNPWFP